MVKLWHTDDRVTVMMMIMMMTMIMVTVEAASAAAVVEVIAYVYTTLERKRETLFERVYVCSHAY